MVVARRRRRVPSGGADCLYVYLFLIVPSPFNDVCIRAVDGGGGSVAKAAGREVWASRFYFGG